MAAHLTLLAERAPGRALDVACGLGRNALALAELGFAVVAVDVSDVAVRRLAADAAARGLPVQAVRADLREPGALPAGPFDVVCCTCFLDRGLWPAMAAALAPDGLLVIETFTRAQAGRDRGPSSPAMLLEPGELAGAFPGLEVVAAREQDDGELAVAGLVARRPA